MENRGYIECSIEFLNDLFQLEKVKNKFKIIDIKKKENEMLLLTIEHKHLNKLADINNKYILKINKTQHENNKNNKFDYEIKYISINNEIER